ncbi:MAG: 30S ribosomal protein S4 [Firmicutes bacterium]|nr:30S ribosomal protein S4 [Bacillota bacterium]
MARYIGPACRLCRREGIKLYLKGDKCYTDKCPIERRAYPPGAHGQGRRRRKASEYGLQLREKQKAKRFYGMMENQFHRFYLLASRQKGITGENLMILLESRLDNVIYRLGLARSRKEARQLVLHGHFTVNGHKVDIPSYRVKEGDIIGVRERSKNSPRFKELAELAADKTVPPWLEKDEEKLGGRVLRLPTREEIDVPVEEHLIVELYSK